MPLGQAVQAGARRAGAKLPGAHMRQSGASAAVVAQPAGHAAHQADCPGGLGHPAQRVSALLLQIRHQLIAVLEEGLGSPQYLIPDQPLLLKDKPHALKSMAGPQVE